MNIKDAISITEKNGTKISREKLIEAIRLNSARDFSFGKDGSIAVVVIPKCIG
jgi:hypothetical protein